MRVRSASRTVTRKRRLVAISLAMVIGLALVRAGVAESVEWSQAALYGADVRSFAIDPADADRIFSGTSGGQVYVSQDGGSSWTNAGPAVPFPGWVISSLQFDPNRPERLWLAARGVFGGGMVAFSEDGGESWTQRGEGLESEMVFSLALVPGQTGKIYAGTREGVYGSTDDGRSWTRLTAAIRELKKVTSLAVDPTDPESVLAGTWRQAYRSEDGGKTWRGVFNGMILDTEVFSMQAVPGRAGELWASTCGWVYHGVGWGDRWQRFKPWEFDRRRTVSFAALSPKRLIAGTVKGLEISEDGGQTWHRRGPQGVAVLAIGWDARRPQRLLIGLEGPGVWRSEDGGQSFKPASQGLTNVRIRKVLSSGDQVFAAVRDAGPDSGIWRLGDDGHAFIREAADLPPVLDLATVQGRVLAATEKGLYEKQGSEWRRVGEVGDRRVDLVESDGGAAVVATQSGLYRLVGTRFEAMTYQHGTPRSLAVLPDAVWVTDASGMYRLQGQSNHVLTFPGSGRGTLLRMGSGLLWSAGDGVYRLRSDGGWDKISPSRRLVFETGSDASPVVLIDGAGRMDLLNASGDVEHQLQIPVPVDSVSSVAIHEDRLLLATNGQGLWSAPLPSASDIAEAAQSVTAAR